MVDHILNSVALRWVVVVVALGLLAVAALRIYGAGAYYYEGSGDDPLYLWEDSSANVCDDDTEWADEVEDAADNYDDDTNLDLTWTDPCGSNKEIFNTQANYGLSGWKGFAYTSSGGGLCWNWRWTNYCNNTNRKVDRAEILWNDAYYDQIDEPEWQALHEMGHVFGLRHPEGSECNNPDPSVMFNGSGNCDDYYEELQSQDIDDINEEY